MSIKVESVTSQSGELGAHPHVRHPACADLLWVAECLGAPVVEADDERADNDLRALAILVALVLGCGLQIIGRIRDAHDASVRRAAPRIISSGRGLRIRIHLGDLEVEVRGDGHCRGVRERVDPAARRVRHGLAGARAPAFGARSVSPVAQSIAVTDVATLAMVWYLEREDDPDGEFSR